MIWPLFIVSHLNGLGLTRNILSFKPLRLVGICSFSMYLLHAPIIGLVSMNLSAPIIVKVLIISILTIIASMTSHIVIEKPFLKVRINKLRRNAPE
jgi:peptidoglycan/LPS O-acetylase OafA/YrhL